MAYRSDRGPLSLNPIMGKKPVKQMRRGSADSIGAGRDTLAARPDIKLQPNLFYTTQKYLCKLETSI